MLTINIMTAALAPGDAIGNYILTSARLWREWGAHVNVYADSVHPVYKQLAHPSRLYWPTGKAILWYHYSIYADNVTLLPTSTDWKVMDFHGITPPHLFAAQDEQMQALCQQGWNTLPALASLFDACVVHSDYSHQTLLEHGFDEQKIIKLPLCVDTYRFAGLHIPELAAQLSQLDYLLFVGRIVPQKDILAALGILAALRRQRPSITLVLVGSRAATPAYQQQIDQAVVDMGLADHVLFLGQVNDTAVLATLLQNARFLLVTSEWESFCVPVVEAMYFGVPSIVHKIAPLPEVAGAAGIVIDKHKPEQTAETILSFWHNPIAYQRLATTAKKRAAEFTDNALAQTILKMMQELPLHDT
jgi:glycosyltransferase involved in cell wall biosynthesis